jgi:hypothetical protein
MDGENRQTAVSLDVRADCRARAFFLHIPKTAGTTLRVFLRNQYPSELVCPVEGWDDIRSVSDFTQYRLFLGHFSANFVKFLPADTRTFTFMRHPLSRVLSTLRHLKRDPAFHALHDRAKHLSMSEIIRDDVIMRQMANNQTGLLSAVAAPQQLLSYIRQREAAGRTWEAAELEDGPKLTRAIEVLARMEFVGIAEDFQRSINALCQRMNFHPPLTTTSLNEAPDGDTDFTALPEADQKILRAYNRWDLVLYDLAKKLFVDDREHADRAAVLRQLADLGIYQVREGPFEIDVSGPMPGSGWYLPEEANGRWFRWTGSEPEFSLEVPLRPDCSYRCTLTMIPASPAVSEWLAVAVNGTPTAYEVRQLSGRNLQLQFTIVAPTQAPDLGLCEIVLRHADVHRPSDHGGTDFRRLGFSVGSMAFSPTAP